MGQEKGGDTWREERVPTRDHTLSLETSGLHLLRNNTFSKRMIEFGGVNLEGIV